MNWREKRSRLVYMIVLFVLLVSVFGPIASTPVAALGPSLDLEDFMNADVAFNIKRNVAGSFDLHGVGGEIDPQLGPLFSPLAQGAAVYNWAPLGSGMDLNVDALVLDGTGNLYAGGRFTIAGGVSANRIARWDGTAWSALGIGMNDQIKTLAMDSSGMLFAGGWFTSAGGVSADRIARWDGSSWSALGTGMNGVVEALVVDGTGNLYAGGSFTSAGGVSADNIAMWDGSNWNPLGLGMNNTVHTLTFDGSGNLYAGGDFTTAGGVIAQRTARWNGISWSALGTGMENSVRALVVDGSGDLYAGGWFLIAGGVIVNRIARWNGSVWSSLGSGMNSPIETMALDGSGNLYAGGQFTDADGVSANYVARWDGSNWNSLGTGTNGFVLSLVVSGIGELYAGGAFTNAGGVSADRVAVGVEIQVPISLPDTGFAPGLTTSPSDRPLDKTPQDLGDLWLDIPKLSIKMPIVGVKMTDGEWDTTWLVKQAGWLEGTAFPTWAGNTALSAHVWDQWNQPGPFHELKQMQYGDRFYIHAWGLIHTYEVNESLRVYPSNLEVLEHSDYDVVTLLTCESYSLWKGEYRYRRAVKAVLVDVAPEKYIQE